MIGAIPNLRYGARPEKSPTARVTERLWNSRFDRFATSLYRRYIGDEVSATKFASVWQQLAELMLEFQQLTDDDCAIEVRRVANEARLGRHGASTALAMSQILRCMAGASVLAERSLGLVPHREQLFAVWAMCNNRTVDMQTGEGKSLTAAIAAAVMAMTGSPVHVISVNEYLVKRDAERFKPFFDALSLTVSIALAEHEDTKRREAYQCDVLYLTGKQVAFDYLRDRVAEPDAANSVVARLGSLTMHGRSNCVQRGLCVAIVDEIDSILVDEARVPLILADPESDADDVRERAEIVVALGIARRLEQSDDYQIQKNTRTAWITQDGHTKLRELAAGFDGVWQFERYRSERVRQALIALHVYKLDRDYIVRDGTVQLIDESTGRVLPDRRLQQGLHRFLEVLQNCDLTTDNVVRMSISFQEFFNRYQTLVGMSGSVTEVAAEMRQVYALNCVTVPAHRDNLRVQESSRLFVDSESMLAALGNTLRELQKSGRPVLIGTRSVQQSEKVSTRLRIGQVAHQVLNARQDTDEAKKVATAGVAGAITVATNMAGRGTDIPLELSVAENGGLAVMSLSINDSRRVDKQLFGRSARQGDPGSCCHWTSLDDPMVVDELPVFVIRSLKKLLLAVPALEQSLSILVRFVVQRGVEHRHTRARWKLFKSHIHSERRLAIGGVRTAGKYR